MDNQYDIIIIGGGPGGLSAAINGVLRGCRVLALDTGATKLALAERVDNYPGLTAVTGKELMAQFEDHARRVGASIVKAKVTNILPVGRQYMVSCGSQVLTAKAVILALGAFQAKTVAGEDEFLGKGVSYCATCDGMLYRQKRAVVYGLAADAAEEANYLAGIGVNVVYINPGGRPKTLGPDIEWRQGVLRSIRGDGVIQAVDLELPGGSRLEMEAQGLFLLRDAVAPQAMISGLDMDGGFIRVSREMMTNLPGLFACGDCTGQPLQIAKAVGEGLIAGQEAAKYCAGLQEIEEKKS
jgi:thioredoxin reductase (NADPH)